MAGNTKTVLKGFEYQNCDDFAAYLGEMSAKGWHFREWGVGLIFERGEPRKVEYAVEVFTDGTEYDTRPEPQTKEFAEYCEAAGWKLLDSKRKFCIFKKISPDALPILTDQERLNNTARAVRRDIWYRVGISVCFLLMKWVDFSGSRFAYQIFSGANLALTVFWTVLFASAALRCIQFYLWKHKLQKAIERGQTVTIGREKGLLSFTSGWYTVLSFVLLGVCIVSIFAAGEHMLAVYMGVLILLIVILGMVISKLRPDSATNQIIQLLFSVGIILCVLVFVIGSVAGDDDRKTPPEDIPLSGQELGWDAGELEDARMDITSSFFGSWTRCTLDYEEKYVYYNIYQSEYPWVLDRIWEDAASARYNQAGTDCTELWGAVEAYRNGRGEYLVRYEEMILTFSGNAKEELSPDQIRGIREALTER